MITFANSNDRKEWNQFVAQSKLGSFLQSWEWGEFQESLGRKIFRLKIINKEKLVGVALIVKHDLPYKKSYLYSPRGPVFGSRNWSLKIGQDLLTKVSDIAQKENAIFFRIEPKEILKSDTKIPRNFKTTDQVQPKMTQILNLQDSEDDLLKNMHHKTRYNIRLANRKGVIITSSTNPNDADKFWQILLQTTKRDKFKAFSKEYYREFIKYLSKSSLAKIYIANFKNEPIAAIIMTFFGSDANYIHGASSNKYRNVMAPHLLQWQAIKDAKKMNYKWYDMWGVSPKDQPKHKWAGISRFKKGFGGKQIEYLGSLDYVYKPAWYASYKISSSLKKIV